MEEQEEDWEELQSPWRIETDRFDDDHFLGREADSVLPPENLSSVSSSPTPPPESPHSSPARASSSSSSSSSNSSSARLRLWIASFEARRRASKAMAAWRFWTVAAAAGAAAVFLLNFIYRRWRRRSPAMIRDEHRDRLAIVLREKDERIDKLLVQIAEMNEALSARRRVPVIRVS